MTFWKGKDINDFKNKCFILNKEFIDKTCCSTGHRPQKLPWGFNENDNRYIIAKKKTRNALLTAISKGYLYFISGMALGFDIMFAEVVLELKEEYPNIKLICIIPCEDQSNIWNKMQQARYHKILAQADYTHCLYKTYKENTNCMIERNNYMLNISSLVIALFNGKNGGTKRTLDTAKAQGKEIIIITP